MFSLVTPPPFPRELIFGRPKLKNFKDLKSHSFFALRVSMLCYAERVSDERKACFGPVLGPKLFARSNRKLLVNSAGARDAFTSLSLLLLFP